MSAVRELKFNYSLPSTPGGEVVELSFDEAEKVLLNQLDLAGENSLEPMWQLARFYSHSRHHEKALEYLRRVVALQPDTDHKAATVLAMGQTMEQVGDFESAVCFYREAFAFEPLHTPTWYLINNNLGYSLNRLGRFDEGEQYCRAAIEVDPARPNGFKNLGISLSGKGQFERAAECFVRATQADASDARSLKLLEELLQQHETLRTEFQPELDCCRKAVEVARQQRAALPQVVVRTGWRKSLLLLKVWFYSLRNSIRKSDSFHN